MGLSLSTGRSGEDWVHLHCCRLEVGLLVRGEWSSFLVFRCVSGPSVGRGGGIMTLSFWELYTNGNHRKNNTISNISIKIKYLPDSSRHLLDSNIIQDLYYNMVGVD